MVADGDVFTRLVHPPRWQKALRQLFRPNLDNSAIVHVVGAAAEQLRESGCPALPDVVAVVKRATMSPDPHVAVAEALMDLGDIRRRYPNHDTVVVVEAAVRHLQAALGGSIQIHAAEYDWHREIAKSFIADCINARLSAHLLDDLVASGEYSCDFVHERCHVIRERLCEDDNVARLARQLVADVTGARIALPRVQRQERALAETLQMAVDDIS